MRWRSRLRQTCTLVATLGLVACVSRPLALPDELDAAGYDLARFDLPTDAAIAPDLPHNVCDEAPELGVGASASGDTCTTLVPPELSCSMGPNPVFFRVLIAPGATATIHVSDHLVFGVLHGCHQANGGCTVGPGGASGPDGATLTINDTTSATIVVQRGDRSCGAYSVSRSK